MNIALIVSAYLRILSTNNVNHCTQLVLLQQSENYLINSNISNFIRDEAANYIFQTSNYSSPDNSLLKSSRSQVTRFQDPRVLSIAFFNSEISLNNSFLTLDKLNRHLLRKEYDFFLFIYTSGEKYRFHKNFQLMSIGYRLNILIIILSCKTATYFSTSPYSNSGYPSIISSDNPLFYDGLTNFNAKLFRITTPTSTTSLVEIREESPLKWIPVRGYQKFALEHLMRRYNFTASFFPSIGGGGTGFRFKNGTWVGSVGDILSGRADIGLSSAQIYARNLVVDFTLPMGYTWLTFTTGKGLPQYSWKSTYWPLSKECWYFSAISSFATFGAFSLIHYVILKILKATHTASFMFRSVVQQDTKIGSEYQSVRILGAFWLILGLVMTTAYRCKLVPMLAYPILEQPPSTFNQLAGAKRYQISLQYVRGAAYVLLKTSPNPTLRTIFKRMHLEEDPVKCFSDLLGSEGARKSCVSWVDVSIQVQHKNLSALMQGSTSPLVVAQDTCYFVGLPLMLKKGAVFRERFNQVIERAVDMGLVEKWKIMDRSILRSERVKWSKSLQKEGKESGSHLSESWDNDKLKLQNLIGPLYLLCFGLLVGWIIFVVEMVKEKLRKIFCSRNMFANIGIIVVRGASDFNPSNIK